MRKKNHEILAALQYKLLYNISGSEKWGKKIQAGAYNGTRTVVMLVLTDPNYLRNTSATDKNKIHNVNI